MKYIIYILITAAGILYGQTFLMSDYDLTNQNYTMGRVYRFCKSYKNNPLDYGEIVTIVRYCHIYKLHPIPVLAKLQLESDLVVRASTNKTIAYLKYRAMGYGLFKNFRRDGKKFYTYGGYQIQVYFALKTIRKLFDEYRPGLKVNVLEKGIKIVPDNAATYALYRYTPFYDQHNIYNWKIKAIGNRGYIKIYKSFMKKWEGIK